MLTRRLQHLLLVLARTHNPDHDVVGCRGLLQQQGRVQSQPTKQLLLLVGHRDGNQFRVLTTGGRGLLSLLGRHLRGSGIGRLDRKDGILTAAPSTTAPPPAIATALSWRNNFGAGRGRRTHQSCGRRQRLKQVFAGENGHMAQTTTAGASPTEQFIDVLPLTLAGEFHQAQFAELCDLRAG